VVAVQTITENDDDGDGDVMGTTSISGDARKALDWNSFVEKIRQWSCLSSFHFSLHGLFARYVIVIFDQWHRNEFESGEGSHVWRRKNYFCRPLHFFDSIQVRLVVLVSSFVIVSTVWSVSCLLFSNSRCPSRAQPFVKLIIIIIIIIIRNLYIAIMPLGGYRGAGGTGRYIE